jgi:hypothetical protein
MPKLVMSCWPDQSGKDSSKLLGEDIPGLRVMMGAVFVSLIGDVHASESLTLTRTAGFFILACLTSCIESHPVSRGCNL